MTIEIKNQINEDKYYLICPGLKENLSMFLNSIEENYTENDQGLAFLEMGNIIEKYIKAWKFDQRISRLKLEIGKIAINCHFGIKTVPKWAKLLFLYSVFLDDKHINLLLTEEEYRYLVFEISSP